jgi:hypothetical protein
MVAAGAVAFALVLLGWRILAFAAADLSGRDELAVAIAMISGDPEAAIGAADDHRAPLEHGRAWQIATRALSTSPLSNDAIRVLALVAERAGHRDRAAALMATAADRAPYDAEAQVWTATHLLKQGDVRASLAYLDRLLRARPAVADRVFPGLAAIVADSLTAEAVVELLNESPPWRGRFVEWLARQAPDAGVPIRLLIALQAAQPWSSAELRAVLRRLVGEGAFEQAFLTWARFLPLGQLNGLANLHNGDFELAVAGVPFDWQFEPVRGASMEVTDSPDRRSGQALRVEFNGSRIPFRHVSHLLMLVPGDYRFEVAAMAEALETERGLSWRIYCLPDRTLLGATETVAGSSPWASLEASFAVPEDGCPAQLLGLELDFRASLEQQVAGRVWFDDAAIHHVRSGPASPPRPIADGP